ncbi:MULTISPECIES: carbohydrate ABC transporter permease [Eisenbergiella]|uniref:Carbohydrate ABC transporter permease n=1 Tax=Eisenbergiella porci TaxID=2652274 RepID=A0A6N7WHA4_9FIRM|nr:MULTISPECIES: carbohydrate ABC transporter permease [Eisenbergiella]MCI6707551.1 carbohydrate ABC transporter permease [Eisenbergiella massiliensis]MDY2654573.1 carbohydrate ABC transporter permease [Eisenbergiella porci]MDY5524593.1 carbohydrate ABC transporter permease [Eisenbergiella porci]MSS89074.1 carbohydrate ABC transporter permease [Eisenbergiella porci]
MLTKSYKRKVRIQHSLLFVILMIIGLTMLVPFFWTLSSSFKYDREIFEYPIKWIPEVFRWSNYQEVWTRVNFLTYYLNTIKLSIIVTVGQVVTCSLAAYSFAKMDYPGRDKIFLCYLATMMVPWHAIMIPQFIIIKNMGFYDSHWSIILMNLFSAFGVFLLRQFMLGIPMELSEAARIDGCGELKIYSQIIMPMCKPGLATLIVFTFNFMWNDYMGPMIYLNTDKLKTIQIGLAAFRTEYGAEYGLIMAGTVCSLLPMVLIYCVAQKYLIEGIAFSGLKG